MEHEELLKEIKNTLEEDLKEYLQPFLDKIPPEYTEQAKTLQKDVSDYIEKNPLKSVGFAFLAGVLISRLLSRKDS